MTDSQNELVIPNSRMVDGEEIFEFDHAPAMACRRDVAVLVLNKEESIPEEGETDEEAWSVRTGNIEFSISSNASHLLPLPPCDACGVKAPGFAEFSGAPEPVGFCSFPSGLTQQGLPAGESFMGRAWLRSQGRDRGG